jgi:hypothetical protein
MMHDTWEVVKRPNERYALVDYDRAEWGENPLATNGYSYELHTSVDSAIAAGEVSVSGEGPGMFFHPTEEKALAFARQLLSKADAAGYRAAAVA